MHSSTMAASSSAGTAASFRFVEIDQAEVFHGGGFLVRIDDPFVR